jgi:glutaredoxin
MTDPTDPTDPTGKTGTADPAGTVVEFYWRPGCPYCAALRRPLRRSGLPLREVNIWGDTDAAARVRSATGGNETVPTVFVGTTSLVNPSMGQVWAAVRRHDPALAAEAVPTTPRWQPAVAVLGSALLWVLLAARTPTTTYHLAPLLVAAAAPLTRRWLTGTPVPVRTATALAAAGLAATLVTTAALAGQGMLVGPDLTGVGSPVMETVLLAVVGAVAGWWLARRTSPETSRRR